MIDAFQQVVRLVIMRVAEDRIRSDPSNDVAVGVVVCRGIGVLVVERVVGDQTGELHRGGVLRLRARTATIGARPTALSDSRTLTD